MFSVLFCCLLRIATNVEQRRIYLILEKRSEISRMLYNDNDT